MRYDLTDIRLFVAVADAGNVSKGAAACHLAPSSASLRIRQLEDALGTALFERRPRGVTLTKAGRVMLESCRRCLAELEQMHANLAPYAQGVTGRVTLFATSTAVATFLPNEMAQFLAAHPSVRVTLEEHTSTEIVGAVAEGRADIGIVNSDDEHPTLRFHRYRDDELVVIAPPSAPFGRDGGVRFIDCLAHPFVSLHGGTAIHAYLVGKAAALGVTPDIRIQVAGFATVVALVRSGAGIAIVPRSVIDHLACDDVRVLTLCEPWARRVLSVCWPADGSRLSNHVRALLRQLCGEPAEE